MSNIRLINLSNYIRPAIIENKSKDWVLNGRNNSFYQYIIDRYNGSTTNASIINSYNDLIFGRGLGFQGETKESLSKLKDYISDKDLRMIVADFELFGEASIQVIKTKGKDLSSIKHIPKNLIVPSIVNENNEINSYWLSNDWSRLSQNPPQRFASFGTSKDAIEIFNIKPYSAGKIYFCDPEYLSSMPYAEVEEEIANLYINSIKQGLSAGYIINIPDGVSYTAEEKDEFEKKIKQRLTGSTNASNFIISFNGADVEVTVTPFPTNENIHKQWEFLTEEAKKQLLTGHRATSPSLVGLTSSSGFSSTAEEMDMAEEQLVKRVIRPKQNYILDSLTEILSHYGKDYELFFKPLTEKIEEEVVADIVEESVTELKKNCNCNLSSELSYDELSLYSQDAPEGYELTDGSEYDLQLAATAKSEQDTKLWKVRYAYTKGTSKSPKGGHRSFCRRMLRLSDNGRVFRKEDIEQMKTDGVNSQFGQNKQPYSIWLYGGGVNCYHRFERRMFKKKTQENGELYGGNALQNVTEVNVSEAKRQGAKIPRNNPDVAIAEIDKPNKGSLKNK